MTRFQIRTAVYEISNLTLGYKMMFVFVLGLLASTLNPAAAVITLFSLPPAPLAVCISSIFTAYLLLSSMFNRSLVASPQISYLKQLPIDPNLLLAAHVVSLFALNIFFLVAYVLSLGVAYPLLNLSWFNLVLLVVTGSIGMALGQVHYAWARTQTLWMAMGSITGFFLFNACLWYLVRRTPHLSNPYLYFVYTAHIAIGLFITRHALCQYSHSCLYPKPLFQAGWLLNIRGMVSLAVIDYIAIWRMRRNESIFRLALCGICFLYILVSLFNNVGEADLFKHIFVLSGSLVEFLLISTLLTGNREYRKSALWVQDILPFKRHEIWISDFLAIFFLFIPIASLYMCMGTWLFQMSTKAILIQSLSIALIIAILSASTHFFSQWHITEKKRFIFFQIFIGTVAIVIFAHSLIIFACLSLLIQIPIFIQGFRKTGIQ